jgi:CRP/FNR family cyclic AMP-dependent transcriptional regulator
MIRVLPEEHAFSDLFLKFLLARTMRTQADLVDRLFNASETRCAHPAADGGVWQAGEPETLIPKIMQETSGRDGTTRSRVRFLMDRGRKLARRNTTGVSELINGF